MMLIHVGTITANYCTDSFVHVEVRTVNGKSVDITLPAGTEEQFLNDLEDALVEMRDAKDKGAAFRLDRGAA
ncbi:MULTISPECIES: hypothetical protein [unclassified Brevibacterium]|uniref:hypothetical protein n=1 Tax=unclassified Brevibacterium TaxID=2614124 RepID=UPI001E4D3991|nr:MULTISPECIES: hypothetical protein [unclassified Brevibacterium]MCD1287299.1 hypothetical protein [Brevibacterium sp. CCUG 69071]MDK8436447.1 hypothetical protein [Brevibacterium sp. H-BE7]